MTSKIEVRKAISQAVGRLNENEKLEDSSHLLKHLKAFSVGHMQQLRQEGMTLFHSLPDEIDISGFFSFLEHHAIPYRVVPPSLDEIAIEQIYSGAFLVPGRAFDKAGNRLGRGQGYYDRLLERAYSTYPSLRTIGILYDCQLLDKIPVTQDDQPVRMLCMPTGGIISVNK